MNKAILILFASSAFIAGSAHTQTIVLENSSAATFTYDGSSNGTITGFDLNESTNAFVVAVYTEVPIPIFPIP